MVIINIEDRKQHQDTPILLREVSSALQTIASVVAKWKTNVWYLQKDYNKMASFERQIKRIANDIDSFENRVYDLWSEGKLYQPNKQKLK